MAVLVVLRLRIGIAWSVQEQDMVPADPWDLPLHMVLTEVELIEGLPAAGAVA